MNRSAAHFDGSALHAVIPSRYIGHIVFALIAMVLCAPATFAILHYFFPAFGHGDVVSEEILYSEIYIEIGDTKITGFGMWAITLTAAALGLALAGYRFIWTRVGATKPVEPTGTSRFP